MTLAYRDKAVARSIRAQVTDPALLEELNRYLGPE